MSNHQYAVILAGGKGERFWPLSTAALPKQCLALVGDQPLITQAVARLEGCISPERIFIVTNRDLVDLCRDVVPQLPAGHIVGEPMGRDTAPAVALGTALVQARDPDGVFCVLTADHVINDVPLFHTTLQHAFDLASEHNMLITIGIQPDEPSTAFGYIEAGGPVAERDGIPFVHASRFVEKPDAETARAYLEKGTFCWNSGMFIWTVNGLLAAFDQHCPHLAELAKSLAGAVAAGTLDARLDETYPDLEKISIDYALMEKADNIAMARGTFGWDDVGSWTALARHFPKDADGNVSIGDADHLHTTRNIVISKERPTALIGVQNLIVVQAEGVTLVCAQDRAQEIKDLVSLLRDNPDRADLL